MSATGDLAGRRILLTGASRGIGQAIAAELATSGAALICVARDPGSLELATASLRGGPHEAVALDVTDERAWHERVAPLVGAAPLHGVVCAAGVLGPIGRLGTFPVAAFRSVLDVNVTGTLLAIEAALPGLLEQRGSIVTLSGGGGTAPLPRFDAYAASKAAVVRLTENLARDLAELGVRANSIAPGFVLTEMHQDTLRAGPERVGAEYFERTRRAVAEGGGDPPELAARLAAFLLSDASSGITGKLLSARWDPWEDETFQGRLRDDVDLATLRRIDDQFFGAISRSDR